MNSTLRHDSYTLRLGGGVGLQALFSGANLALTVGVARAVDVTTFGQFAVAGAFYLLMVGLVRYGWAEGDIRTERASGVSCYGILIVLGLASVGLALLGALTINPYLIILSPFLPLLGVQEYFKALDSTALSLRRAMRYQVTWAGATLFIACCLLLSLLEPITAYAAWALVGALLGVLRLLPYRHNRPHSWRFRGPHPWFTLEYLAGSGLANLTTLLLSGVLGTFAAGGLRAAGTVLAPASMTVASTRPVLVRFLARPANFQIVPRGTLRRAGPVALLALTWVGFVQILPNAVKVSLLGDSWTIASALVLPLGLEIAMSSFGAVAVSYYRVLNAGRQSFITRAAIGLCKVCVIVYVGSTWGVEGAAWAMAGSTLLSNAIWFWSLRRLVRKGLGE